MSVAVDIPRKRIFISCGFAEAYYWLLREFSPQHITEGRAFWMPRPGVLEGDNGWTVIQQEPVAEREAA